MKPRCRTAFTLVELLVVITIIGMLAALLLPAINHAREAARSADCMNRQRNLGKAMQEFVTTKDYFPGYREVFNLVADSNNANPKAVVGWQVMLWPYLEQNTIYQRLKDQTVTSINNGVFVFPYMDGSVCPSDNTAVNRSAPLTSYIVNTGRMDKIDFNGSMGSGAYTVDVVDPPATAVPPPPTPNLFETFDNGMFLDRVLSTTKKSLTDIKDGTSNTLMITENIDAECYTDGPYQGSDSSLVLLNTTNTDKSKWMYDWAQQLATVNPSSSTYPHNCSERGAGFVWWDTSSKTTNQNPPPVPTGSPAVNGKLTTGQAQVVVINGRAGDFEPTRVGWQTNPETDGIGSFASPTANATVNTVFAARPSSNHPGGVNIVFADGRCKFLSDDIDYSVYCLLMTSNGGVSQPSTDSQFDPVSPDPTLTHSKGWQYYSPLNDGQF